MRIIHCWSLAWPLPLASRPCLRRGSCMPTLCRVPLSKNSSCLRLWRVARSAAAAALRRRWPRWRTRKKETTQACWLQDELLWNLLEHKRLRNPMKKHKDLSYRNHNMFVDRQARPSIQGGPAKATALHLAIFWAKERGESWKGRATI